MNGFEKTCRYLKNMYLEGYTLQEILNYLIHVVGLDKGSRIYFIRYLKEGLNLKMRDAIKIGAWDYFEDGTRRIEEIEKELQPLIILSLDNITIKEKSEKKDFLEWKSICKKRWWRIKKGGFIKKYEFIII